jgi:ATP-dependent protease ClpP protease subunit
MATLGVTSGAPRVYVNFMAEIIPQTAESLMATLANLANNQVKEVYLLFSSQGGDVRSGIALYNMLKAMPFNLITHNVGNVDSIGNVVFLAGKERYATSFSTFMFHGVGFDINQRVRFEEKLLKERLDGLLADQKRIGAVIAANTQLSRNDIAKFFREGQTKDAAFAASHGIINQVRDVQFAPSAPILSLVFQRQPV